MDAYLDQFCEDQINGGYSAILDQMAAEEYIDDSEPVCLNCDDDGCEHCFESEDDVPLDGDHETALRDAGWGMDEDYGYFGSEDDFGGDW